MRIFGLVGYPLSHSFSKRYFTDKFQQENIHGCVYENFEAENLRGFKDRLNLIGGLEGFNITIPYKEKIISLLDIQDEIVQSIKACNCVHISDGTWKGHNTDVPAFKKSFEKGLQPFHTKALILGTGGASLAVRYVLRQLGLEIKMVSDSKVGDEYVSYNQLTEEMIQSHPVIINCTPVGMYPSVNECPRIPYSGISSSHYLYDLIYNPELTVFLQRGRQYGARVKNGYEMLVLQAEESWRIWNS